MRRGRTDRRRGAGTAAVGEPLEHADGQCVLSTSSAWRMLIHMRTTLVIDDHLMHQLKAEAAGEGRTMSDLVETSLRTMLGRRPCKQKLPPLPTFNSGGARVDVADRDALYHLMEGR